MAEDDSVRRDLMMLKGEEIEASTSTNTISFFKLFSFADTTDKLLIIVGTAAAVANGISMPIVTVIAGQLFDSFGLNSSDTREIVPLISKICLKFVYLAVVAGVAAFLHIAYFDQEAVTGEVVKGISGDTVLIQDAIGEKVGKLVMQFSAFTGGFVIAFIKGWLLTLVMISAIPLLVVSGGITSLVVSRMASNRQHAYSDAARVLAQTIGAFRTVVSFTGEKDAVANYNKSLEKAYHSGIKEELTTGLGFGLFKLFMFCSYSLGIWFGARTIAKAEHTGGEIFNVILAVLVGSMSLAQVSPCITAISAGQAAAFKLFQMINRKCSVDLPDTSAKIKDDIQGDIELRNIFFSYPSRPEDLILSGFSLFIPRATSTALVGHSGSGKSTIISLIDRFYDPQAGDVLIDSTNLKEFRLKWIREKIGLVSQEPVLFAVSIKENIAYGKDNATIQEIRTALEQAGASKFIDKLPKGLETVVGQHGTQLSGGQKQRIAIARAILKDPRILLQDEATSALDAESERFVQEALDKVMVGRTTIVVAHRLSTTRNCDMIVVVEGGKVLEKGAHSELIKNSEGAYSKLMTFLEEKEEIELSTATDSSQRICPQDPMSRSRISLRDYDSSRRIFPQDSKSSRRISLQDSKSSRGISLNESSRSRSSYSKNYAVNMSVNLPSQGIKDEVELPNLEYKQLHVPLRRLAQFGKPEVPLLFMGAIFAVLNGAVPPLNGIILSRVAKTFYEPPHELLKHTKYWALAFVALGVLSFVASSAASYLFGVAGCKLIRRIRSICFEKVVHMEVSWFDEPEHSTGVIGARLYSDVTSLRAFIGDSLAQIVTVASSTITALAFAFYSTWQLTLIIMVMIPFLGLTTYAQIRFNKGFSSDAKRMYEEASQVATDALWNIRTIASFCAEDKVMDMYRRKCEEPTKMAIRQGLASGIGFGSSSALIFLVQASIYYAGARFIASGKLTFSDLFQAFFAIILGSIGISEISSIAPDSTRARSGAASILDILESKSKIDSKDMTGITLENVKGDLDFRHVTFKYPTRPETDILRDLCLTINDGEMVALVGESGSGKSTVISLLQRFYDPESGHITLDGVKIKKFQVKWLRQQMGLVSQEPVLFNDTIRANIAYGRAGDATESELTAAAQLANAHIFISGLEKGYETIVGEYGTQLSGGQKQRVAIARAIVKNPKILLLDEATSALDAESERIVQDALDNVIVTRTTVVVAHRLSMIKRADVIAVVKNGMIIEKGKHEVLINKKGFYASMVAPQLTSST